MNQFKKWGQYVLKLYCPEGKPKLKMLLQGGQYAPFFPRFFTSMKEVPQAKTFKTSKNTSCFQYQKTTKPSLST